MPLTCFAVITDTLFSEITPCAHILSIAAGSSSGEFVIITDTSFYKRVLISEIEPMARYRKGVKIATLADGKIVYASSVKEPYNLAVIDNFGVAFMINTEDLSIESRTAKGKTLKSENKKRSPEKVFKI